MKEVYEHIHMSKNEIIQFYDKKAEHDTKEGIIKALSEVRAEIETLAMWHGKVMIDTVNINKVLEVIDNKREKITNQE